MDLATNPYAKKIFKQAELSKVENIVTALCNCKKETEFYNGSKPEYYGNFKKAAFRFHYHKELKTMFWAVHYRGKHIVGIKDSR